jgi:hypothetical protein
VQRFVAFSGVGNLLNEFWPDIQRKTFKKKQGSLAGDACREQYDPLVRRNRKTFLTFSFPQRNPISSPRIQYEYHDRTLTVVDCV